MKRNILAALITLAICGMLYWIFVLSPDAILKGTLCLLVGLGCGGLFFTIRETLK